MKVTYELRNDVLWGRKVFFYFSFCPLRRVLFLSWQVLLFQSRLVVLDTTCFQTILWITTLYNVGRMSFRLKVFNNFLGVDYPLYYEWSNTFNEQYRDIHILRSWTWFYRFLWIFTRGFGIDLELGFNSKISNFWIFRAKFGRPDTRPLWVP